MKAVNVIIIFFVFVLKGFTQTAFKNVYSVKAFLPAWNGATVLLKIDGQTVHLDTIKGDMASFNKTIETVKPATLEVRKGTAAVYVPLYIEPGTIRIRDKGNRTLEAFGTATNDASLKIKREFDSLAMAQPKQTFEELRKYKKALAAAYVKNNPASLISLQLLNDYFFIDKEPDTTYAALFYALDTAVQHTTLGAKIAKDAFVNYNTAIGRTAPNILLPDTDATKTPLYKKGQITLIDFWASWCRPCRIENRYLVKVFDKYKDQGFTITSVSLDNNARLWKEAILKDNLTWQHLSDLKGWYNAAVVLYGIKYIPMNILVNEDGVVIAKNLSANMLEHKLEQLMLKSF
ncbi:MAG TPA: TlpA disulfide reductase family protein [Chitinophagaceae bacterium]|nr:TlpA disulfide reductase family protein [Chitinophagaceae bacterium]